MFTPLMKQKVEEGIRYHKLNTELEQVKKARPAPYAKASGQELWCPEVPKGGKGKGGKGKGGKGKGK